MRPSAPRTRPCAPKMRSSAPTTRLKQSFEAHEALMRRSAAKMITNHQATSGTELKTSRAVAQNPPGAYDEHQGVLKPTSEWL